RPYLGFILHPHVGSIIAKRPRLRVQRPSGVVEFTSTTLVVGEQIVRRPHLPQERAWDARVNEGAITGQHQGTLRAHARVNWMVSVFVLSLSMAGAIFILDRRGK